MSEKIERIAIVNKDKCRPNKCRQECRKSCPVNKMGRLCIDVTPQSKIAFISETLCIGCGICTKKCPFGAITIINLPTDTSKTTTHRYSANSFKLHRLPCPRRGQVLGLVGTNGIGKSTALKILANKLKPNLGRYDNPPDWQEILEYFRGSELQNFFTKLLEENMKAVIKPQFVDVIKKTTQGTVNELLTRCDERNMRKELIEMLDLENILDSNVADLSGGELQRFAIAATCMRKADIYMFDEPSSYLDVKQRLSAAKDIRSLTSLSAYIIVVEHDLSVLDYLSDSICVLYGKAGAYGFVTMPFGVREGINIFLDGMIPTENLRFRSESLVFRIPETISDAPERTSGFRKYPQMTKTLLSSDSQGGKFELDIEAGYFSGSEILVMLGENGTGKSTFIKMLAGLMQPDNTDVSLPSLTVSYKPQEYVPAYQGTVKSMLLEKIPMFGHSQFQSDVARPLDLDALLDHQVEHLSGGELQRVAIALCLGTNADLYLIDEPSAYLDSEQRIAVAKLIKRYIMHTKKTAFIVEHDFVMATYLADRVIVYEGKPAVKTIARSPEPLLGGMNRFLESLQITFRRDPKNFRPRINKPDSVKDREQKQAGTYFFLER